MVMRNWIDSNRVLARLFRPFSRFIVPKLTLLGLMISAAAVAVPVGSSETQYLAEMQESMMRMHVAMAVSPTGTVDGDFVAMMVPHHQGAIDMARIQLRYGHNEQLRRIAQEIIVEQQQEIAAMRFAVGDSK
jgi:uncharacterized protein (DUF305 family)